jgi:hypothetical protein
MTFPDDQASPAAPFSGDGSGEIFDAPDLVFQSPTTSERIVDTQSGYLVVIKAVDQGRQSLSVKRRIGTPPSSSVLLTPDESLKLSRVLVGGGGSAKLGADGQDLSSGFARRGTAREAYEAATRPRYRNVKRGLRSPIAVVLLSAVLLFGVIAFAMERAHPNIITLRTPPPVVNAVEPARVEKFSREFIAEMLDFNPQTYRQSQVHAMAVMAPELFNSYWTDTHFPLSAQDLKRIPQGNKVVVKRVAQTRLDADKVEVNVYGDLVHGASKTVSPIHVRLKVVADADKELRVVEQSDVTTE